MTEDYREIGIEISRRADENLSKSVFFAALLVITHLLSIKPSEVDAGGIKVSIADVSVIHGGISIVFFYFLLKAVILSAQTGSMLRIRHRDILIRSSVFQYRRLKLKDQKTKKAKKLTPKQIKMYVKIDLTIYQASMAFLYASVAILIFSAIVVGIVDVIGFGDFVLNSLTAEE